MPNSPRHSDQAIEIVAKLPMRQRVVALSDAIMVSSPDQRDAMTMMLIEIASYAVSAQSNQSDLGVDIAASPLELITRIPKRWRARHADDAMMGVARSWNMLSMQMKELGVGLGRDRWLRAGRALANDPDPRARVASAMIAHDTADPGFGKIVGALLADEHQSVRKAADKAMMRMTMVLLEHLPDALLGKELAAIAHTKRIALPVDPAVLQLERCILLSAIADAAWSFSTHRCRSPLLASLLVMDRAVATPMEREISSRMHRLLCERNHPSHSPLRTVLRRTPSPILRERALRWLPIAPMSTAAIDRLATSDSLDEHEVVLRRSHLAIRPKRATKLGSLRNTTRRSSGYIGGATTSVTSDGFLPRREDIPELCVQSRLGMIRFSSLISMDDQTSRGLLEPMLADPQVQVRYYASQLVTPIDLPDYMFDIDSSIARSAALRWSSVGLASPRMSSPAWNHRASIAKVNARSPHAWVRRFAAEESDRLTIVNPSSPASRVHARRMYASDPAGFVRIIRDHLANPATQCDALMLIRIMGVEHRFELDLISLVQSTHGDARARATAVMALGVLESQSARYILSEALNDEDHRIRSNAAESVQAPIEQILELKSDSNHRVRASAIRRVIRDCDTTQAPQLRMAGHALLEMLHDARPMHRLAATWAAHRGLTGASRIAMGSTWKPLIHEIESIASNDGDTRVRQRATRCIERVSSDMEFQHDQDRRSLDIPTGNTGYDTGR